MKAPRRRFVFLGTYRLDELYGEMVSAVRSAGKRIAAFNFSALGIGGGIQRMPEDKRVQLHREIERLRRWLDESKDVGSLDEPGIYSYGRLSMYFVPFDKVKPATLYMVGETDRTFVALGGQLKDVCNRDDDYAKAAEDARLISSEREVVRALSRANLGDEGSVVEEPAREPGGGWEADVVLTHTRLGYYPDLYRKREYEILAYKDEFTPAKRARQVKAGTQKGVLLGKPLFVAEEG
jgi:hypothetical protein